MKSSNKTMESPTLLTVKRKSGLDNAGIMLLITISLFVVFYVFSVFRFQESNFGKYSVFFNTFFNRTPYLLVLSLGLTVVMITGSIDISVGGVVGLVAMVIAVMLTNQGVSAVWTIPAALGIGLAFGAAQGFLVAYMQIQPFIVTLIGMFFARGMISMIRPVSVPITDATPGGSMFKVWSRTQLDIPFLYNVRRSGVHDVAYLSLGAIIIIVSLIIVIILLKFTRFGRSFYAVGGNEQSALLMGIDARWTKFMAHVMCGILASIGGFVFTLGILSGSPDYGRGYEINAIASSVIGGVMLSGGVGLPIGTFFGVLINLLVQGVVPLTNLKEEAKASLPPIITSAFLLGFIVLQSVLVIAGRKGGIKQLLPEWLRFKNKERENASMA
ncbi:MAG: sugar ABC transporter permease YjfF [Treponema sp.]|jgi:simple sugar transport system permease protein|nr:sugar ABC transporter permease YjfF [Treponema sp.]